MELLTAVVGGMIGFLGHHILFGRKIMSQLDDLAAAQAREAANIQALASGLQALSDNLTKTLGDMKTAVDASKVSGNTPDLTGFIEVAQKNASAIGQAITDLNAIQATVVAADPSASVAVPEPVAEAPAAPAADTAADPAPVSDAPVSGDTTAEAPSTESTDATTPEVATETATTGATTSEAQGEQPGN
jgi:hypothetical protein